MITMTDCRLCGAALHMAPDHRVDEYSWQDERGRTLGDDPDVAHLQPDPYAYLAALAADLARAQKVTRKGVGHTWLYWRKAREYSALKVRLETGGTFHVHWAGSSPIDHSAAGHQPQVPEHCGWPMWLRPSGWHCRQGCGHVQAATGADAEKVLARG